MRLSEYSVEEYGKVAVLMGGESAEREISLESGKAIYAALLQSGINAHIIDYKSNSFNQLLNNDFDRVFLALHGRGGEDGTVQKKLEAAGLPYTGSNASASALAMDKIKSKSIWHKAGISTPKSIEVNQNTNWQDVAEKIGLPIMIKPVREGSSFGAAKINRMEDLCSAWMNASQFDDRVMAESWVTGNEYTVPILGEKVLPMIKLETKNTFYDYDAKYNDINTKDWFSGEDRIDETTKKPMPRIYKLEDTDYDPVVHYSDETELNQKKTQAIVKSLEWDSKIPTGIFYKNELITPYTRRLTDKIPNYVENPSALQNISKNNIPITKINQILDSYKV